MIAYFLLTSAFSASAQQVPPPTETNTVFPEGLCGKMKVPPKQEEIPWIGCFRVSPGGMARGVLDGHQVEVTVDPSGIEACLLDGAPFDCSGCIDRTTNLDQGSSRCPAQIRLNTRESDKSVVLYIARRVSVNAFVSNQEGWDYAQQRQRIAATSRAPTPGGSPVQTPIPPGPYSSWPEDIKAKALAGLRFRCMFLTTAQLGNYRGPEEAGKQMGQALYAACLYHQMPADWPERDNWRRKMDEHYDTARTLDPSFISPDNTWGELSQSLNNSGVPAVKP